MNNKVTCYIDGACSNNPGEGGWGVVGIFDITQIAFFLSGSEKNTTNNRMELLSAVNLLIHIKKESDLLVYTDSQYLKNGITTWIHNWQKNGWKTANKKPVKNMDLWQLLLLHSQNKKVKWQWIKAHNNNLGNDLADMIAVHAKKLQYTE